LDSAVREEEKKGGVAFRRRVLDTVVETGRIRMLAALLRIALS